MKPFYLHAKVISSSIGRFFGRCCMNSPPADIDDRNVRPSTRSSQIGVTIHQPSSGAISKPSHARQHPLEPCPARNTFDHLEDRLAKSWLDNSLPLRTVACYGASVVRHQSRARS